MTQCNLCGLSFVNDEDLNNHKKEHPKGEKVPTLAETSVQLIKQQQIAHERGESAAFGFGVGDPVAAAKAGSAKGTDDDKDEPTKSTTTTSTTTKKPGEK